MKFKQKLYFSIFLIVIIFSLLILLFIFPTLRNIINTSRHLAFRRQELSSIKLLGQSFEDFEKNFYSYKQGLKEMDSLLEQSSLIDPEIPISFINFFNEQVAELNLSLTISPAGFHQEDNGFWNYMNFQIDGTGRLIDMMRFFERMENGRWLIEQTSLSITGQEKISVQAEEEVILVSDYIAVNLLIKVYAQN